MQSKYVIIYLEVTIKKKLSTIRVNQVIVGEIIDKKNLIDEVIITVFKRTQILHW